MRALKYISLVLLLAIQGAAVGEGLPLDYFIRHDDFGEVKLSPDGAYLAASAFVRGRGHIFLFTVRPLKAMRDLHQETGGEVREFAWTSPVRIRYKLANGSREFATPIGNPDIFAVDRDGKRGHDLFQSSSVTGFWHQIVVDDLDDDDRDVLLYITAYKKAGEYIRFDADAKAFLAEVNTYTGTQKILEQLPVSGFGLPLVDAERHARAVAGYDESEGYTVMWKPQKDWRPFQPSGLRPLTVVPLTLSGQSMFFKAVPGAGGPSGLYRVDFDTEKVEPLYSHPEADIGDLIRALSRDDVIGVRVHADTPEIHWLKPEHPVAKLYDILQRAFPEHWVELGEGTQDQRMVIAHLSSDVDPGNYYLVEVPDRHAEFLVAGRSWVDPAKMRHKENVKLKARDGRVLYGYVTRPRDASGPYPLIVLPHDGPRARDYADYDWQVQLLANYGYAVLQVNYRGSTGFGDDFMHAGDGEISGRIEDDLTDATLWAVAQGIASKGNICIYGTGFGGYLALMGAIREPDLYRCAATVGAVTDLELYRDLDMSYSTRVRSATAESLGDTQTLRARSPLYNAERLQVPVLLAHGTQDWSVRYEHATRMRKALEDAERKFEFVSMQEENTAPPYDEDYRKLFYDKLLDFFAAHLRGGSQVSATEVAARSVQTGEANLRSKAAPRQ